jgi:hypothetical protein
VRTLCCFAVLSLASLCNLFSMQSLASTLPMTATDDKSSSSDSDSSTTTTAAANNAKSGQPADASGATTEATVAQPASSDANGWPMSSRIGVGVKVSLLGLGIEAATPITYRTNVRVGFNAFSFGDNFNNDGVKYDASLRFRSLETHFDWFPFAGSFHLSPGLMLYNGNQISAGASVPGLQTFTLNHTTYLSDSANPVGGSATIGFNKVAPTVLFGFGNLLPRKNRRFSVPFEVGAVFGGSPQSKLNLTGFACNTDGTNCRSVITDSGIQSNIAAQQNKLNSDMSFLKAYPVISLGFGYKF